MSESEWKPKDFARHISRTLGIPEQLIKPPERPIKVGDTVLLDGEGEGYELIPEAKSQLLPPDTIRIRVPRRIR